MNRLLVTCLAAVLGIVTVSQALAQTTSPNDVLNPSVDRLPDRLPDLILPQVQFIFDSVLDPDRVSLIQTVMEGDGGNPRLTEAARSIIRNHMIALQQVELSIRFLQSNREDILSGNNAQFNSVFGNISQDRDVAVVDPDMLSTAQVQMGGAMGMTPMAQGLFSPITGPLVMIRFGMGQGGGGGGGGGNMGNAIATHIVSSRIQAGDFLYIGDALGGSVDPDAFVVQVVDIMLPAANTGGQGGGGGGGGNQMPMVTAQIIGTPPMMMNNQSADVFKVVRFDRRPDSIRYDRVLMTFQSIKDALSGFDPDMPLIDQFATPITYQRSFEDMTNVGWAPGVAAYLPLDSTVDREISRTGIPTIRGADRLVRQAGFSNSDSHFHLDRLVDQGNSQLVDYQMNPTTPLLWVEDNELPLNFANNLQVPGTTDENRPFFRDQMTIFGEPDNPFNQYIGRAFLEETVNHPGDFFDDTVAAPGLSLATRTSTRPERGPVFDLNGDTIVGDIFDRETRAIPESGTPLTQATEFERWQMIIESFAEHSTDLDQFNVAAFGIDSIFGEFVPEDSKARAGSNYARFAELIGGSGDSLQTLDVSRIEPFGKRSQSGFFPIVPRN